MRRNTTRDAQKSPTAVPSADLDVSVAANEAYELHKQIELREDATYEAVKWNEKQF